MPRTPKQTPTQTRTRTRTHRAAGVIALTACAAATDALSYLGLGHVFPANMTGNTVLLGLGVASHDYAGAYRSATALGAYVVAAFAVGFAMGARAASRHLRGGLGAELALLSAAAGWWLSLGGAPAGAVRYGLIGLAGAAMGTQSAVARELKVPGIATTYLTGTWTTLATAFGRRARLRATGPDGREERYAQVVVVTTYALAALFASAVYVAWLAWATLVPVCALALAVVTRPSMPDH